MNLTEVQKEVYCNKIILARQLLLKRVRKHVLGIRVLEIDLEVIITPPGKIVYELP